MKPASPPAATSPTITPALLGFIGMILIVAGILHFIFTGDLTLQGLAAFDHWMDALATVLGLILRMIGNRLPEHPQTIKVGKILKSPTLFGVMNGVSLFFLTVVILFVALPVIALVWMALQGEAARTRDLDQTFRYPAARMCGFKQTFGYPATRTRGLNKCFDIIETPYPFPPRILTTYYH